MTVGDLNAVIEQAIGGEPLTVTIDGRNRFSVNVRYPRDVRENVERLRRVLVPVQRGSGMGMARPGSTSTASLAGIATPLLRGVSRTTDAPFRETGDAPGRLREGRARRPGGGALGVRPRGRCRRCIRSHRPRR